MKRTSLKRFWLVASAITLATVSCSKSNDDANNAVQAEQEVQVTTEAAISDDEAEFMFNDVSDIAMGVNDEAGLDMGIGIFGRAATANETGKVYIANRTDSLPPTGGGGNQNPPGGGGTTNPPARCFTVTVTPQAPNVYPRTVTINFGTGCRGMDGRVRRGKIITVYTGSLRVPNSEATTTFENYFVDSVRVEGTHRFKNVSTSNNRSFRTVVLNGRLTAPNGNYTAWNREKTWVQTEGNGTPNLPADDVFSITGSANGTVVRGANSTQWRSEIVQPLIRRFTCRWLVRGQNRVVRNSGSNTYTALLDFGNGTCDNQATLTVNGGTPRTITLR
ncbi:MAG TPA: hypothetical protein DCQ29_05530 [Chitinophagaceae bacterium]|nr:hypothetical protein [Chitinophagaceae bacterium]